MIVSSEPGLLSLTSDKTRTSGFSFSSFFFFLKKGLDSFARCESVVQIYSQVKPGGVSSCDFR